MNFFPALHRPASLHVGEMMPFLLLRRNYPRYPVQKIASYDYRGRSFLTLTLDLGLGGMKIKAHHDIPSDEFLTFKLVLGKSSIFPKGRIVYHRFLPDKGNVSGIQFLEVSEPDRVLLNDYLSSLNAALKRLILPGRQQGGRIDRAF